jgi:hypothetical protein
MTESDHSAMSEPEPGRLFLTTALQFEGGSGSLLTADCRRSLADISEFLLGPRFGITVRLGQIVSARSS